MYNSYCQLLPATERQELAGVIDPNERKRDGRQFLGFDGKTNMISYDIIIFQVIVLF